MNAFMSDSIDCLIYAYTLVDMVLFTNARGVKSYIERYFTIEEKCVMKLKDQKIYFYINLPQ